MMCLFGGRRLYQNLQGRDRGVQSNKGKKRKRKRSSEEENDSGEESDEVENDSVEESDERKKEESDKEEIESEEEGEESDEELGGDNEVKVWLGKQSVWCANEDYRVMSKSFRCDFFVVEIVTRYRRQALIYTSAASGFKTDPSSSCTCPSFGPTHSVSRNS